MKLDAALSPADIAALPGRDLSRSVCVVFDVLRATSCMVTGLAHGVAEILPVRTIEEALERKREQPDLILGGERHGERIEGFDIGNCPFEYRDLGGRRVVTTTTNGTVALRACDGAARVLVGALLNLDAVAAAVRECGLDEVVLVCAGTFETLALEDVFAAGLLAGRLGAVDVTDSARVALAAAQQFPSSLDALLAARNGEVLAGKKRGAEVEFCSQLSLFSAVGFMERGVIRPLSPTAA